MANELIAYHTSISLLIIAQGVLILLLFGVLTVGSQTIRATFVTKPTKYQSTKKMESDG
jgi:hypothetical protein